jgi:acetyl esterase/lipase
MSAFHPDLARGRFIPSLKLRTGTVKLLQRIPMKPKSAPDDMLIEDVTIPGAEGNPDVTLRSYRPRSLVGAAAALYWIHGGGFVQGSPVQDEQRSIETARRLGMTVIAVRYRLAPNHPAPAAIDDAFAGLSWLFDNAEARGVDPARIAIGGASAGGGIAASLTLLAHDRGLTPAFQLLVYPMLDDRTTLRTDMDTSNVRVWSPQNNHFGWSAYLGQEPGGADVSPYAAAARRVDLSGLPATWIGVGSIDLFHDEDIEYARRLREAGVPCELHIVAGAFHGFDALFGKAPVTHAFLDEQLRALKAALIT